MWAVATAGGCASVLLYLGAVRPTPAQPH